MNLVRNLLRDTRRVAVSFVWICVAASACVPVGCSNQPEEQGQSDFAVAHWIDSWDEAVAESKKSGKPILIDFTGKDANGDYWCGPCQKMRANVFDTAEFKKWAEEHVVLLEIEIPNPQRFKPTAQNDELMKKYGIEFLPTVVFITADGTLIGKARYAEEPAAQWIDSYERFAKKSNIERVSKSTNTSR